MRAISDGLKSKLNGDNLSGLKQKIFLYRNYWDGTKYVLEDKGIEIQKELNGERSVGKLRYCLDSDEVNKWDAGNLCLTFDNSKNQFQEGYENGYFPDRYRMFNSKIEYYIGIEQYNFNEWVKCFTGRVTGSPTYRPDRNTVDIKVLSQIDFLKYISAETVSNKAVDEQMTYSGEGNKFKTSRCGVGRVIMVKRGVDILKEGKDYSVSGLNEALSPVIVDLKTRLNDGEHLFITYIYWRQGVKIEDAVKLLLNEACVGQDKQDVRDVIYADKAKGYVKDIGDIIKKGSMNYLTADGCEIKLAGSGLNTSGGVFTSRGTCTFNIRLDRFVGISVKVYTDNGRVCEFYTERQSPRPDVGSLLVCLRMEGDGEVSKAPFPINLAQNTPICVSALPDRIDLYVNGAKTCTIHDSITFSEFTRVEGHVARGDGLTVWDFKSSTWAVSNLGQVPSVFDANRLNPAYIQFKVKNNDDEIEEWDSLSSIKARNEQINRVWEINKSDDDTNWGGWQPYQIGERIKSKERFLQFRMSCDSKSKSGLATGQMLSLFDFSSAELSYFVDKAIKIKLLNFSNLSVMGAIEQLAAMASYEIGFDSNETFFFRPRNIDKPIRKTLTDRDIISVNKIENELNRLCTRAVVKFGEYSRIADAAEIENSKPNIADLYGTRVKEVSSRQLLPADNVDIAYAIAPAYCKEFSKLRRSLSVETLLDVELELGDLVEIRHNGVSIAGAKFSDEEKKKMLAAYGIVCKVTGIEIDFNRKTTLLNLLEYPECKK